MSVGFSNAFPCCAGIKETDVSQALTKQKSQLSPDKMAVVITINSILRLLLSLLFLRLLLLFLISTLIIAILTVSTVMIVSILITSITALAFVTIVTGL